MRKWAIIAMAIGLALTSVAVAGPLRIPSGNDPIEISLFGATSLYDGTESNVENRAPLSHESLTLRQGDELRGIAYVDAIGYLDYNDGNPQQRTGFNPELDGFEISACYHGLEVKTVTSLANGFVTVVEYVPMGGFGVDDFGDEDGDPIDGAGGRWTFYADDSPDFSWDPDKNHTPDDWVEGVDYGNEMRLDYGTAGTRDADGVDELGGDVAILADGVFVPLKPYGLTDDGEVVMMAYLFYNPVLDSSTGFAIGYGNSIRDDVGPSANAVELHTKHTDGSVEPSGISIFHFGEQAEPWGGDFRFYMDIGWGNERAPRLTQFGETGWAFSNNDPVTFINTPEPATTLLFAGPLGILIRRMRRKRRA